MTKNGKKLNIETPEWPSMIARINMNARHKNTIWGGAGVILTDKKHKAGTLAIEKSCPELKRKTRRAESRVYLTSQEHKELIITVP